MEKSLNPFTVISPEQMKADTARQLFVEVFEDFPQVKSAGNSIMFGARGAGKSMMLRCLLPDVLTKAGEDYSDLEFLSFLISVKNTELKITELEILERHNSAFMINEHFFVLTVLIEILSWLAKEGKGPLPFEEDSYRDFHEKVYKKHLRFARYKGEVEPDYHSAESYFGNLHEHALCEMHNDFKEFIFRLPSDSRLPLPRYDLPLLSFSKFLCPFLKGIRDLMGLENKNVYLFIDDADNLSKTQTQVLNSWILARTQPDVSLKVSTQVGRYKSFVGTNRVLIESPHDYHQINISERYTNSRHTYHKRVRAIVRRRLDLAGLDGISPEQYFPVYEKQEKAVEAEKMRILESWEVNKRGYRPGDDALRYARPNYIRDLGGVSKSRSTYMYAGFDQLVHLSSGVVRNFLDSASSMYDEETSVNALTHITYTIQNRVIREKSQSKMFSEFPKWETDFKPASGEIGIVQKLQNLVFAMGRTFHEILVSDLSERRVFSIALSNLRDSELKEVFDFGVQTGYFHEATVGNKDGTGKTWLYILNRLLAPQFGLDPTGFAGYLFVTNDALREAMYGRKLLRDMNSLESPDQLELFD
jgi:DNA replication protein DnaC